MVLQFLTFVFKVATFDAAVEIRGVADMSVLQEFVIALNTEALQPGKAASDSMEWLTLAARYFKKYKIK